MHHITKNNKDIVLLISTPPTLSKAEEVFLQISSKCEEVTGIFGGVDDEEVMYK